MYVTYSDLIQIGILLEFTESQNTQKAAYPPSSEGLTLQTKEERRAMPMYVTYSDLIQIGILLVSLASLMYEIFKGRK